MPDGFAYFQVVTDNKGSPVDYICLQVNPAFTRLTGLSEKEVLGKKVTESYPALEKLDVEWLKIHSQLVESEQPVKFESYFELFDKWLEVTAYLDEPGYIAIVFKDITERKKVEENLLAEKHEKEIIINNLSEQIAFLDPEMRIIWANSNTIERHKLDENNYKGQICYKAYHQLDQPCPECPVVETFKTGKTNHSIQKSYEDKYWQVTSVPVHDQQGAINGVLYTALNINELVISKQELQDSYSLLRLAGETANFGGWSVDLSTGKATWSDQVAIIHDMPIGYSPTVNEAISFYAPEWQAIINELVKNCSLKGSPFSEELEVITSKGRRVWVRAAGEAVKDADDKIIRIQGSFQDISEQKRVEAALRESEERLDLAMTVKNEGIWDWNLVTNETIFDDRYYTMAGYQPGEFPNTFEGWKERVHKDDLPGAEKEIEKYLTGKSDIYDVEFRFLKKDGQWMWINGKGMVFGRDAAGTPLRMVGTHTDITERKLAEEKIRTLNRELEIRVKERTIQLESANRELEAFSYSASHDLRGPLNRISGFSEALLEDYQDSLDSMGKDYLKRIKGSCDHMKLLIDDFLKLSRVSQQHISREPVEMSKLAKDYLKELQNKDPQRVVDIDIHPNMDVEGDPTLIQIALQNLLENAWKYTIGTDKAWIEFGIKDHDKTKAYYIRDNGAGFDMKHSEKLFTAFQRLHDPKKYPGTGIGLSIVSRIITRHGGEIWAEGEPDNGACFYFTLSKSNNKKG